VADISGNTVTAIYGMYSVASDDAGAEISGYPLPQNIFVSAGVGNLQIIFSSPGLHTIELSDTGSLHYPGGSVTVTASAP
jgi:hypothetical protein